MQFGVYRLGKAAKETNRAFSAPQHTQRAIRRIYLPRKGSDIARRACRVYKGAFQPKLGGDDVEAFCERQAGTRERSPFCPNAYGLEADKELILATMRGKAHGAQRLAAQEAKGYSALISKGTEELYDRQFRPRRRMSEYPDKKREVDTVSNRELAKELIDGFIDAQLYTVIGMLYAEKKRLKKQMTMPFA